MRYLVVLCVPGYESEVVSQALAAGYRAVNITVPPLTLLGHPRPAFPGYVFIDNSFDPSFVFIDGVFGCLKINEQYRTLDESVIHESQRQIDIMSERPRGPLASLFGEDLSLILRSSAILFHGFGVEYSANVNVHRAMRGIQ